MAKEIMRILGIMYYLYFLRRSVRGECWYETEIFDTDDAGTCFIGSFFHGSVCSGVGEGDEQVVLLSG